MKKLERLRWRIATLLDKLPGQCWADIADWPLGHKRNPWSPQRPGCRQDMERLGGCYCGKLRKPESVLPVHAGPDVCPDVCPTCCVSPGTTHELSCPEVSVEQMRAELDRPREEWAQWDRRDRWMGTAGWALLATAVLFAVALVWLVTR